MSDGQGLQGNVGSAAQVSHLSLDDQLTFALGSIVRDDSLAEGEAKALFVALRPSGSTQTMQRDFARVLGDCRQLTQTIGLPRFLHELTFEVIEEAADAHRLRNALAHDRWVQTPDSSEATWYSNPLSHLKGPHPDQRTLSEFTECSRVLRRAVWRLRALWIVVPAWLGKRDELEHIEGQRRWWMAMARGADRLENGNLNMALVDDPEPSKPGEASQRL